MRALSRILCPLLTVIVAATAAADVPIDTNNQGSRPGQAVKTRLQVGVAIQSGALPCQAVLATVPVPINWPEQQIRVLREEATPGVRVTFRKVTPEVNQMVVRIPVLPAGQEAHAVMTLEIERAPLLEPTDPSVLKMPERLTRELRLYLGSSPGIESRHRQLRLHAAEIFKEHAGASDWEKIEALYDWTREKVEYRNGAFKGAMAALKDGYGDCEELSSLFIALCRANGIPARTVWIENHCYPEFYMEDDEGVGHWIPCEAAGTRAFGSIPHTTPVLQKGDNFNVPEKKQPQRYISEFLSCQGGRPQVKFIRQEVNE